MFRSLAVISCSRELVFAPGRGEDVCDLGDGIPEFGDGAGGAGQVRAVLDNLASDLDRRLAEVDLGMARRMVQWHEGLARRLPSGPDIVLHDADRVKTSLNSDFRVSLLDF